MNNTISHDLVENRTVYPKIEVKEDKPMTITATEFKKNLGKYLELVSNEDIVITKNGKAIAILKPSDEINETIAWWESVVGILNLDGKEYTDEDIEKLRYERIMKKHGNLG